MRYLLSSLNCISSLILTGILIYTFTANWWKFDDGQDVYYQSLTKYDKIKHQKTIEISKALLYCVPVTNLILVYVIFRTEAYYCYLLPFVANLASMILLTYGVPLKENWKYQIGFIVGWIVVAIELVIMIINLVIIGVYKCSKRSGYKTLV